MDIYSKSLEPFIKKLAAENDLTMEETRKIISSQFMHAKRVMKGADSYNKHWPYTYCPYLGTFKVKKTRQKYFEKKSAENIKDVYPITE